MFTAVQTFRNGFFVICNHFQELSPSLVLLHVIIPYLLSSYSPPLHSYLLTPSSDLLLPPSNVLFILSIFCHHHILPHLPFYCLHLLLLYSSSVLPLSSYLPLLFSLLPPLPSSCLPLLSTYPPSPVILSPSSVFLSFLHCPTSLLCQPMSYPLTPSFPLLLSPFSVITLSSLFCTPISLTPPLISPFCHYPILPPLYFYALSSAMSIRLCFSLILLY